MSKLVMMNITANTRFRANVVLQDLTPSVSTILGDQQQNTYKDNLSDTSASDSINGGLDKDYINASSGGNDWLSGGEGPDYISSTAANSNDILEGGAGKDGLYGGPGSDKIFADSYGEMEDLIEAGETAQSILEYGEGLVGGAGDDFIYASNYNDYVYGGEGNDLMVGGGGNDSIFGDYGCDQFYDYDT